MAGMRNDMKSDAGHTVDAVLAAASEETRAALRTLGELVGNEPATVLSPTQFAVRHLEVDQLDLASTKFTGPTTSDPEFISAMSPSMRSLT